MFKNALPRTALAQCAKMFQNRGMDDAQSAARLLVMDVTSADMHGILAGDTPLTSKAAARLLDMARRVMDGEPVQYVLGYAYFYGLRFLVTPDVLIPRSDTETLVAWALQNAPGGATVLDVCTGSGCLAVAIGHARTDLMVLGGDISEKALVVANKNAMENDVSIEFRRGDLFAPFADLSFDMIVANPPYIDGKEMRHLPGNVRGYEPHMALFGGEDGLDILKRLIAHAPKRLKAGGSLCVEIGSMQREAVVELFKQAGYENIRVWKDMEKRPRAVAGVWEGGR